MNRLGPATLGVLIVSTLAGLGGAYGVKQMTRLPAPPPPAAARPPEPPKVRKYRVPLALVDLPPYRKLVGSDITTVEMTMEEVKKRKLPTDASLDYRFVLGRTLRTPIKAMQPFPVSNFYPAGVSPSLSDRLEPGQRAVTLPVKTSDLAGGFATAGTFVDVLFHVAQNGRGGSSRSEPRETTVLLLQQVEVLALGDSTFPGEPPKKAATTVTLAVEADDMDVLQLVEGRGDFSLVLRGSESSADMERVVDRDTLEALLGMNPPPPPQVFSAEIFRGSAKQTMSFAQPGARAARPSANR